jgi:hypothetical protein
MEKSFAFAKEVRECFDSGSTDARKQIVHALGSNFTLCDKKLALDMEPV